MVLTNIPKNQSFFIISAPDAYIAGGTQLYPRSADMGSVIFKISKDGGAFSTSTNAATALANGIIKLILTADEMNADRIDIYSSTLLADGTCAFSTTIFTGTSGGSNITAADVWAYATRTLSGVVSATIPGIESQYVSEDIVRKASHRHYFEAIGLATITKAKLSLDGNAFVESTHAPVAISGITGCYYIDLEPNETNCFGLMIVAQDASDNAVYSAVLRPKIYLNGKQGFKPVYAA